MRHAHYSTTQRYLHHQPRPEHARLLQEAFQESDSTPISGHARDTLAADGTPEENADTTFPLQRSTRGGTRTRTAAKGQWLLRPSCLTNSTTRAGRVT
jgi:hypothetical protein